MLSIRTSKTVWLCLCLVLVKVVHLSAQEETGAFIVISKEGEVQVLDADEQRLPDEASTAGNTLVTGQTIKTGPTGKIILLLSTGTLTTVEENSEFLLEKFLQKPFEQELDTTVGDLESEPSTSDVTLKLGYGSVVFNVKKLNPGSSFDIDSPVGTAGIRGTDGQLEVKVNPDTGNYTGGVNMLSGTVNFRTVAGGNFLVNAGQSIFSQVSLTGQQVGQIQRRPVPPEMTQRLNQRTNLAKTSSREVKVDKINQARQEAVQKFKSNPRQPEDSEQKDSQNDQKPGERKENKKSGPKDGGDANGPKSVSRLDKVKSVVQNRMGGEKSSSQDQEQLLEVDDQADLAQQGVVLDKESAHTLKSMGLTQDDLSELSKVEKEELKTLLQSENAEDQQANIRNQIIRTKIAEKIQEYDNSERVIIEQFTIETQLQLLNQLEPVQISKLLESYSPANLAILLPAFANTSNEDLPNGIFSNLQTLLSQNLNTNNLEVLIEAGGNSLNETLLELAQQTNTLLSDAEDMTRLSSDQIWTFGKLQANPFYDDTYTLAESLFSDSSIAPVWAHIGSSISILGSLDLSSIYVAEQKSRFAITAKESIHFSGVVELHSGEVDKQSHLGILAGDSITFDMDAEITFAGDHLYIGSTKSMEVLQVSMDADSSLELLSLEDLVLKNSDLLVRGGDEIHLHAALDLRLNGVNFSNNLREIYMQATTIDLRNINFPAGSLVNMATELGGIDGKYPTFPTGDSRNLLGNRQIGRVNFIENVRYNQNQLNNRAQFDQFGQNIIITIRP